MASCTGPFTLSILHISCLDSRLFLIVRSTLLFVYTATRGLKHIYLGVLFFIKTSRSQDLTLTDLNPNLFFCYCKKNALNPLTPNRYNFTYGLYLFLRSYCCKKLTLALLTHKSPKHTIVSVEKNHFLYKLNH